MDPTMEWCFQCSVSRLLRYALMSIAAHKWYSVCQGDLKMIDTTMQTQPATLDQGLK